MCNSKTLLIRLSIILLSFAISPLSFALNIGSKQLNSTLNQKLDANVELLGVQEDDISSITIKLASNAIYQRMGIERSVFIEKLKFSLLENDAGIHFVHISTDYLVTEPFLNFLVELNWSTGYSLREFTIFLDPPIFLDESLESVASPQTELLETFKATTGNYLGKEADEAEIDEVIVANGSKFALEEEAELVNDSELQIHMPIIYEKVKSSETLWDIAEKIRPQNITVEQMMLALQRENSHAFVDNNLSLLKAGAVFRINNKATLTKLSPEEAIIEVSRQHKQWLARKVKPQVKNVVVLKPITHTDVKVLEKAQDESNIFHNLAQVLNIKNIEIIALILVSISLMILIVRSQKFKELFFRKSISADQIQNSLNQLFPQEKVSPSLDDLVKIQTKEISGKNTDLELAKNSLNEPESLNELKEKDEVFVESTIEKAINMTWPLDYSEKLIVDNKTSNSKPQTNRFRKLELVANNEIEDLKNIATKEELDYIFNEVSGDQVVETLAKMRKLIDKNRSSLTAN